MALYEAANVITDPDQLSATVVLTSTLTIGTITGNAGSGTVNVTTTAAHFLTTGDYVTVSGTTNFNGTFGPITVPTSTITSISGTSTVTVDTSAAHNLTTGDYVVIAGTTNFNGTFGPITVSDADTFTYEASGNGTPESSGTVRDVNTDLFSYSETNANADENAGSVDEAINPAAEILIDTTPAGSVADPRTIGIAVQTGGTVTKDGLTLKALYSFLKDRWKADPDLIKFPFPMTPITDEQFEFTNGWNLDDAATLGDNNTESQTAPQLIRTGGWAVNNGPGTNDSERWVSVITLGTLDVNDQVYYRQVVDITTDNTSNFVLQGPVNQAVQYYSDADANGVADFDYSGELTVYIRTWEKTYAQANLADIGVTTLNYQAYRFPLVNAADVKITGLGISEAAAAGTDIAIDNITGTGTVATVTTEADHGLVTGDTMDISGATTNTDFNVTDATITVTGATTFTYAYTGATTAEPTDSPAVTSGTYFNNMDISWETAPVLRSGFNASGSADGSAYFKVIIDNDTADQFAGAEPSIEQVYAWTQAQLRRSADINSNTGNTGIKIGVVVPLKLQFVGDAIFGLGQSDIYEGVAIDDYNNGDINNLHFWGYGSASESSYNISGATRTTNVVEITTSATHDFSTGDYITIANVEGGATSFNGTFGPITDTGATTFTFAQTGGDESATASTGTAAPAEYQDITFPFSASLVINFGQNLVDDADAIYKVFFTNDDAGSNTGRDFGTVNAIVVNDGNGDPMSGDVSGSSSVTLTFAYDTNQQRGNGTPQPAPITAVAIGLSTAQYITATTTINRTESTSISLVAPLERNYQP